SSLDVRAPAGGAIHVYTKHHAGYRSERWGGRAESMALYVDWPRGPEPIDERTTNDGEYAALVDARLEATVARDGRGMAPSIVGGASWRYVALDGGTPFLCLHHTAPSAEALFAAVPSTRALVDEIFREPARHAAPARLGMAPESAITREVRGALSYAARA